MSARNNANRHAETDVGPATRRQGNRILEAQHSASGPINQARPNQDPQSQTAASLQSFNSTGRVVIGQITDCTALAHIYRVQFEKALQPMVATFIPRTTCASFGAKDVSTLQVGTTVICLIYPQLPWCAIIGTLPIPATESRKSIHSIITGSTRNRVDDAHRKPFSMPTTNNANGYIPDLLAGRPFDAILGGEVGWVAETGMKIFQDQWMALIGVDEMCGLSFFYHDSMARLAGYNLQIWSAVRECESINDQDEMQDWTGYAGFPWEQMGMLFHINPTSLKSAHEWQVSEPWYSKIEPKDDWMMPWHREREFHGYLGQGGKRITQAPPTDGGDHVSYAGGGGIINAKHPGLLDIFGTQDGRFCLQSAKGISLVKRSIIISPVRLRRPEQPETGDTETNYKFSSEQGEGPDHVVTGDIETSGPDPQFNRASGVFDMHAYFFNYVGLHPFFYHEKDYKTWDEKDADWSSGKSEECPPFGQLAGSMYLSPDQFKQTWKIDHRYNDQDYYSLSCGIELLDDGGMVLYGGMGEELRMAGGHPILSGPGDVWLKSGRNVNVWAGWDFCARAKNSFDITATEKDGRLKTEKNFQILAGNSGMGGVLIESRAEGPIYDFDKCGEEVVSSGVVLRAPDSEVVSWGMNIYLRTGGGKVKEGTIMIDASKGSRDIITQSQNTWNYVSSTVFHHFGVMGEVEKTTEFSKSNTVICSDTCVDGHIIMADDLILSGNVLVAGGHIFTERAKATPFVLPLDDPGLTQVYTAIAQCKELAETTLPDIGVEYWQQVVDVLFYAEKKAGNDDLMTKAEMSLRLMEDYRTEDFRIYEDRWQQMGRLSGNVSARWKEKPVTCKGQDTYPYPGKENYEGTKLYTQDLLIFDIAAGRAKPRGDQPELAEPYKSPKFDEPTATSLDDYLVIR